MISSGAAQWSPEVTKVELELSQEYAKIAQQELIRVQQDFVYSPDGRFAYEPFTYPWCAAFTPHDPQLHLQIDALLADQNDGQARITAQERCAENQQLLTQAQHGDSSAWDSVVDRELAEPDWIRGILRPYYALCHRLNDIQRPCPLFEPRG